MYRTCGVLLDIPIAFTDQEPPFSLFPLDVSMYLVVHCCPLISIGYDEENWFDMNQGLFFS